MTELLLPFQYNYMINAMWVSTLIGSVCAFLSCYLMLKGWSLIGDALSHAIVPGVAFTYLLGLPFSLGAFFSGGLAAATMLFLKKKTPLKEDAVIGLIFSSFFALGLFIISIAPMAVDIKTITLGNILAITPYDTFQIACIGIISLLILTLKWRDFLVVFFDETYARSLGISPIMIHLIFFTLLSACCIAALETVGAFLVVALIITPGATAYLLTDHFPTLIILSILTGALSSFFGAYFSFFLDVSTGGLIVIFQTFLFFLAFLFAPKHGFFAKKFTILFKS